VLIILVRLVNIINVELFKSFEINHVIYFHLITFNCESELTPSSRLVDRLPYSYGWIDGVED